MSDKKYNTITETTNHPLEEVFDIESNTTIIARKTREPTILVDHELYDDKDKELEGQLQEIADTALEAFHDQSKVIDDVDSQFIALNQEVSAQYLNTALAAISKKADIKQQKDKLSKIKNPGDKGNNIIVSRNDLLRALQQQDPIDGEFTEE
jgi:hypothetical protein